MSHAAFLRFQIYGMLTLSLLFAFPHVLHRFSPHYGGLMLIRSTDDGQYQAKVRAALLGRVSEVSNGMTGGNPPAEGGAPALLELIVGSMLSWTTLKSPQVMLLFTIFITPLIFPFLSFFLLSLFGSRLFASIGSALYVLAFLSPLQKPIHMSLSLPLTVVVLFLLYASWRQGSLWKAIFAGIGFGALVSVYFWSWTYVWAILGWLWIFHLLSSPPEKKRKTTALLIVTLLGLLVASPTLLSVYSLSALQPSIFLETAARSTIIHSRGVESLPRSLLLVSLALLFIAVLRLKKRSSVPDTSWIFPAAMLLSAITVMHQNLIHGTIFTFSSHYYPFVSLSALVIMLWALRQHSAGFLRFVLVAIASIFILAALLDYRVISLSILIDRYELSGVQHLGNAMHTLDDGVRDTVLTDKTSAHMVTAWTDDDTVFTAYVRHILVSDLEYAERYCLTEIYSASGPDFDWLAREVVERSDAAEIERRTEQFQSSCVPVLKNPQAFLRKYGVTLLLWNETLRPDWKIDPRLFSKVSQGEGWSVWKVR